MNYELPFRLHVSSNGDIFALVRHLKTVLHGAVWVSGFTCKLSENLLSVRANASFDASLSKDQADGWLYYPYEIQVYPDGMVSLDHQLWLAKFLSEKITSSDYTAVIVADFEELL